MPQKSSESDAKPVASELARVGLRSRPKNGIAAQSSGSKLPSLWQDM